VKINNLLKYFSRFLLLQISLTLITIFYFDNFLIWSPEFKYEIYLNLIEDKNRFLPFVSDSLITVDGVLAGLIFLFLIIIYSTTFYTYVNELSFSMNRNLLGEYFQIYLLWTSYLLVSFFILRFNNLFRGNLLIFSFLIPLVLLIFRNTEFISSLLGRSVTNETFITFNLDDSSRFRNLRIMTFRKNIGSFFVSEEKFENDIMNIVDSENKKKKINLIVIESSISNFSEEFEKYLINLNKKVLIISGKKIQFNNNFLYREELIDKFRLVYFNNDIQYGSKFILKRVMDIVFSFILIILFSPFILIISILIFAKDGNPIVIKQNRVGLHGDQFDMLKFRTMKNKSHERREELSELNKSDGPLFKIENDPRILNGLSFIREMSLDEIPQLINVLKGEMSIVGPRPLFDDDTKLFDTKYMRRLNVMPGITGLLQINERNATDFQTWYEYDIKYIENWNLFLDLEIILKTPFAMFSKKIRGI
jgi:lipopolysaccharide/colanic/teichoic acid biosynthesis glycosyltransferase